MEENLSKTQLENLSNEILHEIFVYLNIYESFQIFFHLNQKFQNLFLLSKNFFQVDLSNLTKVSLEQNSHEFFQSTIHQINSLYISNTFIINSIISSFNDPKLFLQLEILYLKNLNLNESEDFFNYLCLLPKLSSLTIYSINDYFIKTKIFRLSSLKYCKLSFIDENSSHGKILPQVTTNFSPIEHLIIDSTVCLEELLPILSYVPNLRLLYLLTDKDDKYLKAQKWEHLIKYDMTHLRIFNFQHQHKIPMKYPETCRQLIERFSTSFSTKRKWFFTHQHYQLEDSNSIKVSEESNSFEQCSILDTVLLCKKSIQDGLFSSIKPFR
ncbi:hypothetical protein I4U23_021864 [Adineta vaga]|nr:hypothetical protein I4U23_021864 [Adineta vaga]